MRTQGLRAVQTIALVVLSFPLLAAQCEGTESSTAADAGVDGEAVGDAAPGDSSVVVGYDGGFEDAAIEDAGIDDAMGEPDADAGAEDAGIEDAGGGDGGAADAGMVDSGTTWMVLTCAYEGGGSTSWRGIDSTGARYYGSGYGPVAGAAVPVGAKAWTSANPVVDLSALVAAAATLDTSAAGYVTTNGNSGSPSFTHIGKIYTAGSPGKKTLVESYTHASGPPVGPIDETVVHADPAASEALKYNCISYLYW